MNYKEQLLIMRKFVTAKNYIYLLIVFIAYYSFKQMWEVVFILCVLLMVFNLIKIKLKKYMFEMENK